MNSFKLNNNNKWTFI